MKRSTFLAVTTALTSLILGLLVAQWWSSYVGAGTRIGITLRETEGGLMISRVIAGEPADRAGIRAGDLLTGIEGGVVTDVATLSQYDHLWQRGVPLHVSLVREGRPLEVVPVPGASFPWFDTLSNAISCLAYLAIGLIAFGQAPNDLRIRLLFLFSVAVALEFALPQNLAFISSWILIQPVLFYLITGTQMAVELHLASVIPTPISWFQRARWLPGGYYAIGIGLGVLTAMAVIGDFYERQLLPLSSDTMTMVANRWGLLLWSLAVVAILGHQVARAATARTRHQATLVLLGVLPWAAYQVLYQFTVPVGADPPTWMAVAQPTVLIAYPIAVFVAIFKYHLLDIQFVLRRSLVFILVTAALVALFSTAFGLGNTIFASRSHSTNVSLMALSLGMLVLGLLFSPVRRFVQQTVDRRFFPESQEMARQLTRLAAELPTQGSTTAMGKSLVEEITRVFGVTNATLLVADPASGVLVTLASSAVDLDRRFGQSLLLEPDDPGIRQLRRLGQPVLADQVAGSSRTLAQRLHAFGAELVAGLSSGETLVGLLLLGPKVSGERFRSSETEMLSLFTHTAATVFENARLFESATYESMTGLLRREAILKNLAAELQRALRYGRPLAVGMVDIDFFKRVNDSFGHLTGDALLKQIARHLQEGLRATDSIGRYGGEEFLFVLPETSLDGALSVAEKLRSSIETLEHPIEESPALRITVSIGLAALDPGAETAPSLTDLIAEADSNLLIAKRTGRNRVVAGPMAAA